jgi:hypothetical protein
MVFAVQINLGRLQNCSYKMVDTKNSDTKFLKEQGTMKQYKIPSIDQSLGVKSMVHETQPMSMAISSTSPRTIQLKSRKRSQNSMQVAHVLTDETLPTSMAI